MRNTATDRLANVTNGFWEALEHGIRLEQSAAMIGHHGKLAKCELNRVLICSNLEYHISLIEIFSKNPWIISILRFDLAIIDGVDENNYIFNKVYGKGDVAFGLSDTGIEGTFQWVNGGNLGWSHWHTGEPSDAV